MPSLREIGCAAPCMQNGSLPALAAVVDKHADLNLNRRVAPECITLNPAGRRDLVAFLQTLESAAAR
jgi:cytochrome c peroxidase